MRAAKFSWPNWLFGVLLAAAVLPGAVRTYKILLIPYIGGKSHTFAMAAIANGLATQGHEVTFLIAENFQFDMAKLRNRTKIDVVRYRDMTDGVHMDYDAMDQHIVRTAFEYCSSTYHLVLAGRK